jgi:hypothetical protein
MDSGPEAEVDARPRPDGPLPTFDAETRDVPTPRDARAPVTCADWCTASLAACGDPEGLAREQCDARCASEAPAGSSVPCLREISCVELRAAFSRDVPVCGLAVPMDASRPDATGTDARPDVLDAGADARPDATAIDARPDATTLDAGTDARPDVVDAGMDARPDATATDATTLDARPDATTPDAGADARPDVLDATVDARSDVTPG